MNVWSSRARRAPARAALTCMVAGALVSVAAACAGPRPLALPGRGGNPRELPGSSGESRGSTRDAGLAVKRVVGKEPPTTLIAEDGMRCIVTARRYRETHIGDDALCAWRTGQGALGPRWFGRARHLTTRRKITEVWYDLLFRGGWAARLTRPIGLQGTFVVATHSLAVDARGRAAPPIRVAFASDLHSGPTTHPRLVADACRALADAAPDLLLLGGDFVSFHARYIDRLVPLLAGIGAPLGKLAVLGNHDLLADDAYVTKRLADAGVRVLVNANVRLPAPHDDVWVCGLDNTEEGAPDGDAAFAGADGVRLLLMHSPDGLLAVRERAFAAAFCGHTHGGQFWIRGRPLVNFAGPLSRKYLRGGVFHLGGQSDRVLLVSRGIGFGNLPLRRGADPEVHLCTLS